MLLALNTAAQSATIYSTVDPLTADINTLSETLAGGFESNTPDNKDVYAWGLLVPIANQSILRTAVMPINVGPSTGVRLDVFEVPNPPAHTQTRNNRRREHHHHQLCSLGQFQYRGPSLARSAMGDLFLQRYRLG
ncbi:MAG: hypothetical protein HC898_10955 [Phycisphaerales bacterium]|nr:hypothetical protein [Phycisphaerales bacterium]